MLCFHPYILCENQTRSLFYLFYLWSLSFSLSLCFPVLCFSLSIFLYGYIFKFPKIWTTSEIFIKLWKIINLKALLKNKEKLKSLKVTSIREQAGNVCRRWKRTLDDIFPKKLLPSQVSKLTAESLGGCCRPPYEIQQAKFPGNLEISFTRSSISRVLSVGTYSHVMDSILNLL